MWATTEVRPRGKQTALASDSKQAATWIEKIPVLDDLYDAKSYDALTKIVNDWLEGDDAENDDGGTTRGFNGNTTTSSAPKNIESKFKSLDDAFADLEDDDF